MCVSRKKMWVAYHFCAVAATLAVLLCLARAEVPTGSDSLLARPVVVTNQAMGARCAVAADFDGDGRMDIVSASSTDNAVSWFRNLGVASGSDTVSFSIKQQITWSSLGSRIVTTGDIDSDGDVDVIGASYYDNTVRWFENDGAGQFTPHIVSTTVNEGQGVTVADLDNDGDLDIVTASSGDNTVAVFTNLDRGVFCEIKEVVDNNATGVRTVIASDLNGDGMLDLASASKDDDTVAWYPNDGTGHYHTKLIISAGVESAGAYSLVAVDIDQDGDNDLVVASNGNDHVSLWRNDGTGAFTKTLIFDSADFVLSVTAVDFDRDGDVDVASASFFDGYIRWHENMDGMGTVWKNHTVYVGTQGHYVSHADLDGDGDEDLIGVTHAENSVTVFHAATACDAGPSADCCAEGTEWDGAACVGCGAGTYGVGRGAAGRCEVCPGGCTVAGRRGIPATCAGVTGCWDAAKGVAECACGVNAVKAADTDTCEQCPGGQERTAVLVRPLATLGNYTAWEEAQGRCEVVHAADNRPLVYGLVAAGVVVLAALAAVVGLTVHRRKQMAAADALWTIHDGEISYDAPVHVLGKGSFGVVLKGYYRGTEVAVKRTMPSRGAHGGGDTYGSMASVDGVAVAVDRARRASGQNAELGLEEGERRGSFRVGKEEVVPASPMSVNPGVETVVTLRGSGGSGKNLGILGGVMGGGQELISRSVRKQMRKDFISEMRVLAKLRHPCITTVMGAMVAEEPLLVLECMQNGSLRDLLSNPSFPFDPELSLPMLRDVLQGMRFLHAASPPILHGDLKAANILVDLNFRAKVSDFGLSQKRNCGFVGTPFWMAPELLEGGFISTESDVYAFGVTLWELMTRKVPYLELDLPHEEILEQVREGALRPDCSEGMDAELAQCIEDCWAQAPEKRPTLMDLEIKLIPLCGQNLFSVMQNRHAAASQQSRLLHDVFPAHIANDLLAGKKIAPQEHECVTIYFSDIVGFTNISAALSAQAVSEMLDRLYTAFDDLAGKHGVFKLETIGDAWVGVCNLTTDQPDHAAKIARFSIDAVHTAQTTQIHPDKPEMGCVKIRVGFHSGPVVSNVVGTRNPRYCLFGDTMNTASRMESNSEELRIHCSQAAAKLVQRQDPELHLVSRGRIPIKGKGHMRTYWLHTGADKPYGAPLPRIESTGSEYAEGSAFGGSVESMGRLPTSGRAAGHATASGGARTATVERTATSGALSEAFLDRLPTSGRQSSHEV